MLIIRKYRENEEEEIKELLIKEKIMDLEIKDFIYIILEEDTIIGVCKVKVNDEEGFLKYLVIDSKHRGENLGEGLLRAILNELDKKGVKIVYFHEMNLYFLNKGFIKNKENKLELNVAELFLTGCQS